MKSFEDRQKGFEAEFKRNQDLAFRVTARRNRLFGAWAAEKLGLPADQSTPLRAIATPSTATDLALAASSIAAASATPAMTRVRRSPIRATTAPEGRLEHSWPMPMSATTNAAVPTSAPSSRARSATTGIVAP